MTGAPVNRRAQLLCAWSGPVFVAIFLLGMIVAHVVPAPSPSLDADQIAGRIADHRDSLRVGLMLALASAGLYWFALTAFAAWVLVMTDLLIRAIRRQAARSTSFAAL